MLPAKIRVGILPLQTLAVELEVITGRGFTVTISVASAPIQPVLLVSATLIVTGEIVLKSTLITSFAALAMVAPVTVHVYVEVTLGEVTA
jgi:hypothetical protein